MSEPMKIAVTGGSGFIGSHVADKLVESGHHVVVVDTRRPHRRDVTYRNVNIRDTSGLVRAFAGCDVVFHLAGVSNVNHAYEHPADTFDINVSGTARVWEAARRTEVARTVLASTVWVYAGATATGTVTEESPLALQGTGHVYTASKMAAELVVTSTHELYGQEFSILRYGIPFGPRMRDELVIPRFVRSALDGRTLTIHGDGLQFRSYVYVEDLAEAHLLAMSDKGANQVFNLEGPEPITIQRMAEVIRDLVDRTLGIEFVPARPGDYEGRTVSGAKAAQLLGWTPRTSFVDGMRRCLDWYRAELTAAEEQASEA
jgi:UDP-glucose 4-epimerase